jgi:hypothetical protein
VGNTNPRHIPDSAINLLIRDETDVDYARLCKRELLFVAINSLISCFDTLQKLKSHFTTLQITLNSLNHIFELVEPNYLTLQI